MFSTPAAVPPIRRQVAAFAGSALAHGVGFALLLVAMSEPSAVRGGGTRPRPPLEVFAVSPPEPAGSAGLQPLPAEAEAFLPITDPPSDLSIARLSLNLQKISAHATLLFPFVTPGLALERFLVAPSHSLNVSSVLASLNGQRAVSRDEGILNLDATARQALIDRAWSRRDRWQAFQAIAGAAASSDANHGDLPAILQMYREQNGLQPYVDRGVKDPSFWVYLGLAADHIDFVDFISRYVRDHPGTKSSTELMLLLDAIALGSVEDLLALMTIDPRRDLQVTLRTDLRAYALAVKLQDYYKDALTRKGLTTEVAIRASYDRIRLAILDIVLRTTPDNYRASDVRFLMGEIYWRQGNRQDAIRVWSQLAPDPADTYGIPSTRIANRLKVFADSPADHAEIDRALASERSRWRAFSYERLKGFGYRSDSY